MNLANLKAYVQQVNKRKEQKKLNFYVQHITLKSKRK